VQGARRIAVAVAVAMVAAAALLFAAAFGPPAHAATDVRPFNAPTGKAYAGVSDTGDTADFDRFTRRVHKHLPIMQSFHSWGYESLPALLDRWRAAATRGMLHIQTRAGDGREVITPRQVARGVGDGFLMRIAYAVGAANSIVYLRPFGEMNNWRNAYCAYDSNGRSKGYHYTPHTFRQAWRRIAIITRGGPNETINAKLRDLGMPEMQKDFGTEGLPYTNIALAWTPMTAGSPNTSANGPDTYWPGGKYVDWVGTDIYSKFPNFSGLNRFYRRYNNHPFAITEWGAWGKDAPGFVNRVFDWVRNHGRARMLVYYQGWTSTFSIDNKPRTRAALRERLAAKRYPAFPPEFATSNSGGTPAG